MDATGRDQVSSAGRSSSAKEEAHKPTEAAPGIERQDVKAVNVGAATKTSLYKSRDPVYPKRVYGTFRNVKWVVMALTLGVYYILPWIRWDRGPGAPDQAVLVDFGAPRFYFFFIEIWPQEIYYITGLLIMAAVGLFLVTALFGRVWCGYACPQTVWTDLFVWVERIVQGDRAARMRLAKAPWSFDKARKIITTHVIWVLIAIATGGAMVFYFNDAPTLAQNFFTGQAPVPAYLFVGILTFTTYSLGGLMREQVCIYMCPWPRIQAAMIDQDALAVTYRPDRGEPRGPHKKGDTWEGRGHCIDCKQCVVACPMGIDIRDGLQLECIQCALCVDACNSIMDKVDLPRDLIAYDTDVNIARHQAGQPPKYNFVRTRTVFYATILALVTALMLYGLLTRDFLEVNALRDRIPNYVTLSDGSVRNGYTIKIHNMRPTEEQFRVTLEGLDGAQFRLAGDPEDQPTLPTFTAERDRVDTNRLYISVPYEDLPDAEQTPITFRVENIERGTVETARSVFVTGGNQ